MPIYIVFERTNFVISEQNRYVLSSRKIGKSQEAFNEFIRSVVSYSRERATYVNIYLLDKYDRLEKIAYVKCGDLYTL